MRIYLAENIDGLMGPGLEKARIQYRLTSYASVIRYKAASQPAIFHMIDEYDRKEDIKCRSTEKKF